MNQLHSLKQTSSPKIVGSWKTRFLLEYGLSLGAKPVSPREGVSTSRRMFSAIEDRARISRHMGYLEMKLGWNKCSRSPSNYSALRQLGTNSQRNWTKFVNDLKLTRYETWYITWLDRNDLAFSANKEVEKHYRACPPPSGLGAWGSCGATFQCRRPVQAWSRPLDEDVGVALSTLGFSAIVTTYKVGPYQL